MHVRTPHSPVLTVGSAGAAVRTLTTQLRAQHFLVGDGTTYTDETRDAVIAFQKTHHLAIDGAAGPQTLAALRHPSPLASVDARHGSSYVLVDRALQVVELVRDGHVSQIIDASTGDPALPDGRGEVTPPGTFHVQRKVDGWVHAPLGALYWPSYFNGGIAVHGEPDVPNTAGSHGCVRIPMWAAASVSVAMPLGSTVVVR